MLPARNRRDFDEIPQGAREKLQFVWLERVDDAIAEALEESRPRPWLRNDSLDRLTYLLHQIGSI